MTPKTDEQERADFEAWAASIGFTVTGKYAETLHVLSAESAFKAGYKAGSAAVSRQPEIGEEIMVNTAHDVYTLPLQPSGLSSGPRFVVHVPAPEQLDEAIDHARRVEREAKP